MSDAPKKLSTKDILAAARAEAAKAKGGDAAASEPTPAEPAASEPAVAKTPSPAAPKPPAAGGKPKSTAEILAAARAEASRKAGEGAEAAEAAPAAPQPAAKPAAAKPAAGGAPKSTADILAAARAQAGGAPAAAPKAAAAEKPAAPKSKPAAKGAAAAAGAEGPKLSVQEMLAAVRPASAAQEEPAPVAGKPAEVKKPEKPALPPMPQKPAPSKKPQGVAAPAPDGVRRGMISAILLAPFIAVAKLFATPFAAAWTMMTATTGIAGLATARFMLPNVLTEPPSKFKIGPPTDYDLGTVATKWVAQYGIWVVHTDQYQGKNLIYALISVCTHLGCTPSWLEGEQKFKCPCHGSGFYISGINFEGPAPRPLERAGITIASDGMLEVDKSVKFQEEMGQWEDPKSFFEVTG
jgi:cytochrome b6-f complex iron-sulfur subunit